MLQHAQQPDTPATSLGYTGEMTDPSGLVYLRARYYNPASATFLSRDPFPGYAHLALSRNGYSYVHGNPINYVDPSGEFIVAAIVGGIIIAGVTAAAYDWFVNQDDDCQGKDWQRAAVIGLAFTPVGAAIALSPVAAMFGGATVIAGGILSGRYSGQNGPAKAGIDLYIGVVFGAILDRFLAGTTLTVERIIARGAGLEGLNFGSARYASQWFRRMIGAGVISANQGVASKALDNVLLGENNDVISTDIIWDFLFAAGTVGVLDGVTQMAASSRTSGRHYLNPIGSRSIEEQVIQKSSIFVAIGAILNTNITRPVTKPWTDELEEIMRELLIDGGGHLGAAYERE